MPTGLMENNLTGVLSYLGKMWEGVVWDTTCPDKYASLHLPIAETQSAPVAALAELLKLAKYLDSSHFFVPYNVEASGVLYETLLRIMWESWVDASARTQEDPSISRHCLLQCISCRAEAKCSLTPQYHGEATESRE